MIVKLSGAAVLARREVIRLGLTAIGGAAMTRILPGCVGGGYGEPFGPSQTVASGEDGLRLYAFLDQRFRGGYIPKRNGPFIIEMAETVGNFFFEINGADPLDQRGILSHRLRVGAGDEVQVFYEPFAGAGQRQFAYNRETMDPEDIRIMAEIEG